MSDAAPLLEAWLGPEDVADLYRDLAAVADVQSTLMDDGTGTRRCRLDEAFAGLEDGTARRVQIRYRHQDRDWCDTLLPGPEAVRLVRICEER